MTTLNPLGFFWDIENCPVPSNKGALLVVEKVRQKFNSCGPETEFVCVCDVSKERADVIDDLNAAQVTVIHVSAVSKNAADDKLKSYLRKFSNTHRAPGTIVLITSDVNFAPELIDLRYRCGFDIILLHRYQVSDALLVVAHQKYNWEFEILSSISSKSASANDKKLSRNGCKLIVCDLPCNVDVNRIRERLHQLSCNCGGRVVNVNKSLGTALIRFSTPETTLRALKRLQNEDVFGSRINVKPFCSSSATTSSEEEIVAVACEEEAGADGERFLQKLPTDKNRYSQPTFLTLDELEASLFEDVCGLKTKNTIVVETLNSTKNFVAPSPKYLNNTVAKPRSPPTMNYRSSSNFYGGSSSGCYGNEAGGGGSPSWTYGGGGNASPPFASKNSKRNIMTDKLKRVLGFQPKINSSPTTTTVAPSATSSCNNYRENLVGNSAVATYFDSSLDFVPVKLKQSPIGAKFGGYNNYFHSATVDVRVDNLDTSIPIRYLKQNLFTAFSAVVKVLHVTIVPQSEGGWYALIQVLSKNDAQEAVRRLNQTKMGQNHVVCSLAATVSSSKSPPCAVDDLKRRQVRTLLNSVASKSIPLDKFCEFYDAKFGRGISLHEIEQMDDLVKIVDGAKSKRVVLLTTLSAIGGNEKASSLSSTYKRCYTSSERRKSPRLCFCSKPSPFNNGSVVLSPKLKCCILRDHLLTLLNKANVQNMLISDIPKQYLETFESPLNLKEYGYSDLQEMLSDLDGVIEQFTNEKGQMIRMRPSQQQSQATVEQILYLFLHSPDKELTFKELQNEFRAEFNFDLPVTNAKNAFNDVLEFFEGRSRIVGVRLTLVQKFALRARRLLLNFNGDVLLIEFERAYQTQYGEILRPQAFGFPSLIGLLRSASHVLYMKGRGHSLTVCINRNFLGSLKCLPNNPAGDDVCASSSGFDSTKGRLSSKDNDDVVPSSTQSSGNENISCGSHPPVVVPLATSSPQSESSINKYIADIKTAENSISPLNLLGDGPFFQFLQNRFLFSSDGNDDRTISDDRENTVVWWLKKSSTSDKNAKDLVDDFTIYKSNDQDDAKLTNSTSSASEFCSENCCTPSGYVFENDEIMFASTAASSSSATVYKKENSISGGSPYRKSRLAANFLNLNRPME